jgi:uncharacterized membrane protein YphA (DoxX/SURF4 family)/peroxiredoxin
MKIYKQRRIANYGVALLRIGFGLVFIFSGGLKLAHLAAFSEALRSFGMIPESLIFLIGVLIPVTEIILGAALLVGFRTEIVSQIAVAILVLFTAAIAAKLSEGAEISCACFGPLSSEKISGATVWRNLILLCCGVLVFAFAAKASFWKNLQRLIGFLVIFFLAVEVALLSKQNGELKNRLAMLIGDGKNGSLKPGEMASPFKATNLEGEQLEITYDRAVAKTLLLIFSTSCGACERNLPKWAEIASKSMEDHQRIWGISLNSLTKTKEYVFKNDIKYPVFVSSDTAFIKSYRIFAVPQTILIDVQGRVEQAWSGVLDSLQKREVMNKLCSECD